MLIKNIKFGVLNTHRRDEMKLPHIHRIGQIALACVALFALSACSDNQAMKKCQERQSFETCIYILR